MKIRLLKIFLLLSLITLSQNSFAQTSAGLTPIITGLSKQLSTDINNDNIHGSISVVLFKNNRVLWSGAFGTTRRGSGNPADSSTIYRIGSITKIFTSTLLMQLVEEGKVKLDDPVENNLPEIKNLRGYAKAGKITYRQLASHTAGLMREPDVTDGDIGPTEQWEQKLLALLPHCSFNSKPGMQYLYSNIGVAILGLALSRVSGVPYIQMVQQRILTPLHMDDTYFILPDNKLSRLAQGIENNDRGEIDTRLPLSELSGRGYRVPNGGIFSTPRDLSKFAMSLIGLPPLLTAESRAEMRTVPEGGTRYGLGLMLINSHVFGHNGSVPGYTSQLLIDENSGYGVILMRNYNHGATNLEGFAISLLKELKGIE
jgi:CubicO group peptidase (beta-lactamase class C family)